MDKHNLSLLRGLIIFTLFAAGLLGEENALNEIENRYDSWAVFATGIAAGTENIGGSIFFAYQIGNRLFIQPSWQANSHWRYFGTLHKGSEEYSLSALSLALGITRKSDAGRLSFAIGPSYMKAIHITNESFFTKEKKESVYNGAGLILDVQAFLSTQSVLGFGLNLFGNIAPDYYNGGIRLILALEGNK
jgi:hypothetical protein